MKNSFISTCAKSALLFLLLLLHGASPLPPDSRYLFPIVTSEVQLAGTFGELRPDHFHAGIDIKTGGREGVPILAAASGYVYRIKVSPTVYGKSLYLRHEDGRFTVYAHLSEFAGAIGELVYQKQYASKTFDQDLYLPSNRLPVRAGQLIAYSGNTGNSFAPHLHFELRNAEDRILNPIELYKHLIEDDVPPTLFRLAAEPITSRSRVNGRFEKGIWPVVQSGSSAQVSGVIEIDGPVGIEFDGIDKLSAAENKCGINAVTLMLDGKIIYSFSLDQFAFDEKRYINLYCDYAAWKQSREHWQRCYVEEGNLLSNYSRLQNKGLIELQDDAIHSLTLLAADSYGNTTTLSAQVRRRSEGPLQELPIGEQDRMDLRWWMVRDVLAIAVYNPQPAHVDGLELLLHDQNSILLKPAYAAGSEYVYLHKLDYENLPVKVTEPVRNRSLSFDLRKTVFPFQNNLVGHEQAQLFFPWGAVADTLALAVKVLPAFPGSHSEVYEIGDENIPLIHPFLLQLQPPPGSDPAQLVIARRTRNSWVFEGKEKREDGTLVASVEAFGAFCLMMDSVPPEVKPVNFEPGDGISSGRSELWLTVRDEFSGINSERLMARISGEWTLCEYDKKNDRMIVKLRNAQGGRPAAGRQSLEITAWDGAGNLRTVVYPLTF